jgi:hypothetical protein
LPFSLRFRVSRPFAALLVCVSRPFLACSFNDVKASARVLSRILSQPQTPRSHVRAYRGVSMMLGRAGSGGEYHHRAPRRNQPVRCVHRLKHTRRHDAPFNHLFLLLSLLLLLYASFFSEAARTCTHFPQMRSVVVDHAIATIAPAPCCSRACSPRRTSRYVACHARRRCDGPCEWIAFRVRIRM